MSLCLRDVQQEFLHACCEPAIQYYFNKNVGNWLMYLLNTSIWVWLRPWFIQGSFTRIIVVGFIHQDNCRMVIL